MQNAPSLYEDIYEEGDFDYQYKVNIDGVDYTQDQIWSMKTSRALFTANTDLIGNALVGQIDLSLTKPDVEFSRMAKIKPYVRLWSRPRQIASGWLQKGEFFIDTRPTDESGNIGTMDITGYDAMRKANQKYPSSTLTWDATHPTTLQVVREIARFMGVSVDSRTVTALQYEPYVVGFPAQYTMAEVLGSIAAMYGSNFCMSDQGALLLVGLGELGPESWLLMNERGQYITFGTGANVTRIVTRRDKEV